MEIAPNVHLIPGITANPYLIVDADGLTLIDAGLPGSDRKILRALAGLGHAPKDLKRILITHADFDHVGGLARLKAATGARVYASAIEAEAIAAGHASRPFKATEHASRPFKPSNLLLKLVFSITGHLVKPRPVQVDEILADGQVLPVLGGLRVVETAGHTPGHVSFFAPSAGVLFVGDSIVSEETGLRGSRGANNWDQAKADDAVRKQAALGARLVCPGHGAVVSEAVGKFPKLG
ncbi:MAG: MBL fold metallo-hydrolase [Anaerolineales bacterium]|jgi:glyoxylase-like metal-dependent hydrolase (beta-lactamase superfamily II)